MISALFVDDSEFMRALLKTIVLNHNIEMVGEAGNGMVAVEKYKELRPDIVFMDIMMDEMDGITALRQIMEFDPSARVVMVSSMMHQDPFIDDAMEAGAKAVINKPFDAGEVAEVLKRLLGL